MRFEKSNRTTKATISTRNFDDTFEFEIRHEIREVEFDDEFKVRFEKSNRAMKRKTRIRNSRNLNSTLESKNFDDKFESKFEKSNSTTNSNSTQKSRFEKSNRATKREIRIRNSTRKLQNLANTQSTSKKLHDERQTNDEKLTHTKRAHARTKRLENAHQRHTHQMSGCNIKYAFFLFKNNIQK